MVDQSLKKEWYQILMEWKILETCELKKNPVLLVFIQCNWVVIFSPRLQSTITSVEHELESSTIPQIKVLDNLF